MLSKRGRVQTNRVLTSANDETTNANADDATPNDIETFRNEIREHFCPDKPRSDLDSPLILIYDDVFETDRRYLDTGR